MSEYRDSKRVAKNTVYMYLRMLLIMCVSLYSVRVVLQALGQEDYGLYNVVAGVVGMFSFLTATLASASQRFFAFEIGRNNQVKLKEYFNATFLCYVAISIVVAVLAETVGLWFVSNKLTIPNDRFDAARLVYQFAILSFIVKLYAIPYMSVIIAREKMQIYALVSILEAVLQLVSAFLVQTQYFDRLKLYSVLLFISAFIPSVAYIGFAKIKFSETKLSFRYEKGMLFEILSYCGWNIFGSLASIIRSQGINILLNVFFSSLINAARGIAFQVSNALNQLSNSFFNAVKPQITKTYAAGESKDMMDLVFISSRLCYYLMIILALPIFIEVPTILNIWLADVPEYTILFTRLVIINAVIDSLGHPLMTAVQSTGNIKYYQIVTGGLLLLNLPVSYCFLRCGFPPQITMLVSISISIIAHISRMIFMRKQLGMNIRLYIRKVLLLVLLVTILSSAMSAAFHLAFASSLPLSLVSIVFSLLSTAIVIWYFGMFREERVMVRSIGKKIFYHGKNK